MTLALLSLINILFSVIDKEIPYFNMIYEYQTKQQQICYKNDLLVTHRNTNEDGYLAQKEVLKDERNIEIQNNQEFELAPPVIDLIPYSMTFTEPEDTRFIETELKVLNRGAKTLEVFRVKGSCGCSTSTILNSRVEPLEIGIIKLSINMDGVSKENNIVEYIIESNAANSPVSVHIKILMK